MRRDFFFVHVNVGKDAVTILVCVFQDGCMYEGEVFRRVAFDVCTDEVVEGVRGFEVCSEMGGDVTI